MKPMTKKELAHMDRVLRQKDRNTRYVTIIVDGQTRTYALERVRDGERRWWAKYHYDLGPRYRHARWSAMRVCSKYLSPHYEWVDGMAVSYRVTGRTQGEVLRLVEMVIRRDGAKTVTVVR